MEERLVREASGAGGAAGQEVTKERGQAGVTRGRRRGHVFESCLTQEVGPGMKVIDRISLENPEEGPPPCPIYREAQHSPPDAWMGEQEGMLLACLQGSRSSLGTRVLRPPPPHHSHSGASACCVEQGDSLPLSVTPTTEFLSPP